MTLKVKLNSAFSTKLRGNEQGLLSVYTHTHTFLQQKEVDMAYLLP